MGSHGMLLSPSSFSLLGHRPILVRDDIVWSDEEICQSHINSQLLSDALQIDTTTRLYGLIAPLLTLFEASSLIALGSTTAEEVFPRLQLSNRVLFGGTVFLEVVP